MDAQTRIANKALLLIGAQRILSVTDGSQEALSVTEIWDSTRDAVMRAYPWNCCIRMASLAPIATAPAFGYAHQYQLPTDPYCLRVLSMEDARTRHRVQGRHLLTDAAPAKIEYIARVTDITTWDALLKEAQAARLACDLAYTLSNSATLAKTRWDLYVKILSEARSIDAQEGSPESYDATAWLDARY